jgi:hypothetical protein
VGRALRLGRKPLGQQRRVVGRPVKDRSHRSYHRTHRRRSLAHSRCRRKWGMPSKAASPFRRTGRAPLLAFPRLADLVPARIGLP